MGWTNSIPIFHNDVTEILKEEMPEYTMPYIDDVLLRGPLTQHEFCLPCWTRVVLQYMKYAEGTFSGPKTMICADKITIVGFDCIEHFTWELSWAKEERTTKKLAQRKLASKLRCSRALNLFLNESLGEKIIPDINKFNPSDLAYEYNEEIRSPIAKKQDESAAELQDSEMLKLSKATSHFYLDDKDQLYWRNGNMPQIVVDKAHCMYMMTGAHNCLGYQGIYVTTKLVTQKFWLECLQDDIAIYVKSDLIGTFTKCCIKQQIVMLRANCITIRKGTECSSYFMVTSTHPTLPLDIQKVTWLVDYPGKMMATKDLIGLRATALTKHIEHVEAMCSKANKEKLA
ncbi:hypothetical protein AN958_01234 [Leucoagaricus sp. SymC.cos]|nr:hypothetical protein AN958_01234 [Leucoagaricus sp. SymC.cos]